VLNISLTRPLVFIDLETTGLNIQSDRIIELTALKIYPDGNEDEKTVIVDPGIPISSGATEVHGITDQDVMGKPAFRQYAKSVLEFFNGCDLAGFNLIRFDLPLLQNELAHVGLKLELEGVATIDAMDIFHRMEPRDLEAAYRVAGMPGVPLGTIFKSEQRPSFDHSVKGMAAKANVSAFLSRCLATSSALRSVLSTRLYVCAHAPASVA